MINLNPYLSIDIETTGLDIQKSQILQLAAVYDDGVSPVDELRKFNLTIDNGVITHGESFALGMNARILERIKAGECTPKFEAQEAFVKFLSSLPHKGRFTIAGKNAAGFDLPILRAQGFATYMFSHRVLDVGPAYLTDFGYSPSLNEINKLLGRAEVSHDALGDALDVVYAIRNKMGIK